MGKTQTGGPGCIGQTIAGRLVTDEECYCGHSVREHAAAPNVLPRLGAGQGKCEHAGCHCGRYSWKCFVFGSKS